jgi:hypothetical protein
MVDAEARLRWPAAAHREVILVERRISGIAQHQHLAQRRRGVAIEGQQQAAAGGAVEPVHEEDGLAELLAQAVGGEVGLAARERAVVDHQSGGLVDDREVFVRVEDGERAHRNA